MVAFHEAVLCLLFLLGTCGGMVYVNVKVLNRPDDTPKKYIHFKGVGTAMLCGMALLVLFILVGGPGTFIATDPEVLQNKTGNRELCQAALALEQPDFIAAESIITNTNLGKQKLKDLNKLRPARMSKFINFWANLIFFRLFGSMSAVIPFIICLLNEVTNALPSLKLKRDVWRLLLPAVNVVTGASLMGFLFFWFVIEPKLGENCVHISGHWVIYIMSIACFLFVLAHLMLSDPKHPVSIAYLLYTAIFVQCSWTYVLQDTQTYFHDPLEANKALQWALFGLFWVYLAGGLIAYGRDELTSWSKSAEEDALREQLHRGRKERQVVLERLMQANKVSWEELEDIVNLDSSSPEAQRIVHNQREASQYAAEVVGALISRAKKAHDEIKLEPGARLSQRQIDEYKSKFKEALYILQGAAEIRKEIAEKLSAEEKKASDSKEISKVKKLCEDIRRQELEGTQNEIKQFEDEFKATEESLKQTNVYSAPALLIVAAEEAVMRENSEEEEKGEQKGGGGASAIPDAPPIRLVACSMATLVPPAPEIKPLASTPSSTGSGTTSAVRNSSTSTRPRREAKPLEGKEDFLDAIRRGTKLKPVSDAPKPAASDTLLSSIHDATQKRLKELLDARREQVEGDDEDDGGFDED